MLIFCIIFKELLMSLGEKIGLKTLDRFSLVLQSSQSLNSSFVQPSERASQVMRDKYRIIIDLSQDMVDLVSTGRKSFVLTKASLSTLIKTCSRKIETNDSMIILLFPSPMSIWNQSIVNQNYIENEALVSTVDFRSIQSAVSWERSIINRI